MRGVACHASLALDDRMLIHEWSARFHVALGADRILISSQLDVVVLKCAVRVMAIAALDYTLVHLVMEGHIKRRLDLGVALEAKSRLADLQERCFRSRFVHTVATETTNARLGVRRPEEVGMGVGMAAHAGRIHFLRRELTQLNDLGGIATGIHMGLAGTMATLAGCARAAMLESQLGMRIVGHPGRFSGVASCTGIVADEVSRILYCLARKVLLRLGRRYAGTACGQNPGQCNR